ncbi:MAG: glutamate ligase domain-containing protein, partial [Candidatus Fonsibacter sp.]
HHALNHKLKKLSNVFFSFSLPEGRGNEIRKKFFGKRIKIINDSYNSNPLSLKEAIVNFSNMKRDNINQKKIILIGDMLELGKRTKYYHQHIATLINKTDIDFVICVGKFSKFI